MNYYNEFDPGAAAWLRELIKAGQIPDGYVDERSITEIKSHELNGFTQCHFFAGIGGWSLALKLAGVSPGTPLWTGSCPCQPFSSAGKQQAQEDPRHLWPAFHRLIRECRPGLVFGEQVSSAIRHGWLDGVCADLEGEGYAVGAVVCGAHSVGAPHIRQRLYWVAKSDQGGRQVVSPAWLHDHGQGRNHVDGRGEAGGLDDAAGARCSSAGSGQPAESERRECLSGVGCADGGLGLTVEPGLEGHVGDGAGRHGQVGEVPQPDRPDRPAGDAPASWSRYDLIPCRDQKSRRIEPGAQPLVDGLPRGVVPSCDISPSYAQNTAEGRVIRLRGYGNAIVPQLAAEFIRAVVTE